MSEQETRQHILSVVTAYFLKHGFSRVTTDELSQELGMSKKTLYKHFATKEDLLRECVQMMLHEFNVKMSTLLDDASLSVVEKLQRLVQTIAVQYARIGKTVFDDMRRSAPQIWKEIDEWRRHSIATDFRRFIHQGMESGVFRKDIPDILIVVIYSSLVEHVLSPERMIELPYSLHEVFEAIAKVQYEGILTEEGRKLYHESHFSHTPFSIA
jgi:AcrR family transcriptional regulator